jgi:hypothetical protein
MTISFNYTDSGAHINALIAQVKELIDVPYETIDVSNEESFRAAARAMQEPMRSRVLHMLNYIVFNKQINNVYGGETNE